MYALLGEIEFDLITYFDGFEAQFGAEFAEHAVIDGKPRLQSTGDRLDEIRLQLAFHSQYCDPEVELARLKKALAAHQAMALVFGNGDYKGWFVMTEVQATSRQTDTYGTLTALEASVTLREFVGDKKNPLVPPAVRPQRPPVAAQVKASVDLPKLAPTPIQPSLLDQARAASSQLGQAQSALAAASNAVNLAKQLSSNSLAALGQVPSLMSNINGMLGPLQALPTSLAGLTAQLPEVTALAGASDVALTAARNATGALGSAVAGNVAGQLDFVAGQLGHARSALESAAPAAARLTSCVVTRRI